MGHPLSLSADQEKYLRENHLKTTYAEMSRNIGVCVDTLKRMLVRLGLQEFDGAKYHIKEKPKTWRRPCINCKSTTPRPINQYMCSECNAVTGSSFDDFVSNCSHSTTAESASNMTDLLTHTFGAEFERWSERDKYAENYAEVSLARVKIG